MDGWMDGWTAWRISPEHPALLLLRRNVDAGALISEEGRSSLACMDGLLRGGWMDGLILGVCGFLT